MKKDGLIGMWQEGNDQLFRDEKTDKKMIEKYLNEKTLKGTRSIIFNLIFYGMVQLANLILLSMNLTGYSSNPAMIWILIPQLLITIGILIFGMDLFYKLKEINNYSESLQVLIERQLSFFKRPYELWLFLTSVSAIILMINLNLNIDNDNGSYVINNKMMFTIVTVLAFLFIYGAQKLAGSRTLRSLKAYLYDLQQGVLEQSEQLAHAKKRHMRIWLVLFVLLSTSLIYGIITALRM